MEADFGGYVTKTGLRCSDGRIIKPEAFQHMHGQTVPLVWQHGHTNPENVLGHVKLEVRHDGVYGYGFFNNTPNGKNAQIAVNHKDIDSLSIYANQLRETNKNVTHGNIREVSLVLSGANPGAKIDQVRIQHSSDPDDVSELEDEAFISHMGDIELAVGENSTDAEDIEHAEDDEETVKDIFETLNEKQMVAVKYMIGVAIDEANGSAEHSDVKTDDETATDDTTNDESLVHEEGTEMARNLFEQNTKTTDDNNNHTLSHSDVKSIVEAARVKGSLKHAFQDYALAHGIDNIDILFPDAKNVSGTPEMEKRRTEWVADVLAKTRKTPFSRIKTFAGDLTQDEARAKGYIKGNYKLEEWFGVTKRTTSPTTIYKKQKLDRDDILDITDFDVVTWLKAEMRLMTEEEIARAILIGDGRDPSAEDKVKDPMGASDGSGLRSILNDHELFVTTVNVNVDVDGSAGGAEDYEKVVDAVMDGRVFYKGTGTPTFYTTIQELNKFLKAKDLEGRRYYKNKEEVAQILGVKEIITVEPMHTQAPDVIGILVNLDDYNTGTDRGGELTMFDDFDIDYNQYKYLMETRLSGALTKPKSALVIKKTGATSVLAVPLQPSFVKSTGVVTIPTVTGVVYKNSAGTTLSAGAQTAIPAGTSTTIYSVPASGYHFANTVEDSWQFTRPGA